MQVAHPQRATDHCDGVERPQVERIARGCGCGHGELGLVFAQKSSPAARIWRRRFVERNAQGVVTRFEVERPKSTLFENFYSECDRPIRPPRS